MHQRMLRRIPSSSADRRARSRARRGPPRCRRRSSCPSRRGRGPAGRSARRAGRAASARSASRPATAGRRSRFGRDRRSPRRRRARPTVATISSTSYGRASAIHQPRPGAVGGQLGAHDALDEVVDVDHRAALAAVADHREPAGAHQPEERRLAGRLERTVEPRRPHDHGVEAAAPRRRRRAARPASSTARSRSRGRTARRCGTCRCGEALAPNGLFEETWTTRRTPAARAAAMTLAVPRALTSSKSSTRAGWITPAAWTTSTVPPRPRRTARRGRRDDGRRRPPARRRRRPASAAASSADVTRARTRPGRPYGPSGRVRWSRRARPSQPAAPVTTVTSGGSSEGRRISPPAWWCRRSGGRCGWPPPSPRPAG